MRTHMPPSSGRHGGPQDLARLGCPLDPYSHIYNYRTCPHMHHAIGTLHVR